MVKSRAPLGTVTVLQRDGTEVVLTAKEARKFAIKLLTLAAEADREGALAADAAKGGKGAA